MDENSRHGLDDSRMAKWTGVNTDEVAHRIARHAGLRPVAIGFCGLKDRKAVATQWFSACLEGRAEPNWTLLDCAAIRVLETRRLNLADGQPFARVTVWCGERRGGRRIRPAVRSVPAALWIRVTSRARSSGRSGTPFVGASVQVWGWPGPVISSSAWRSARCTSQRSSRSFDVEKCRDSHGSSSSARSCESACCRPPGSSFVSLRRNPRPSQRL